MQSRLSLKCLILLVAAQQLPLPAQALLRMRWFPENVNTSYVPFRIDHLGAWTIQHGGKVHLIPSASAPLSITPTLEIPSSLRDKDGLCYALDHFYWNEGNAIYRRRPQDRVPERVVRLSGEFNSFVVLPNGDLCVVVLPPIRRAEPTEPNTDMPTWPVVRGETSVSKNMKRIPPWMVVLSPGSSKPLKEIPMPQSLVDLVQEGLNVPIHFVTRLVERRLAVLHPPTGRLFVVDTESFAVREVDVPWPTLSVDSVRRMAAHAKTEPNKDFRTCWMWRDGYAGMNLRWLPLGPDRLLLFYRYIPLVKDMSIDIKDLKTGTSDTIPDLFRPDAHMTEQEFRDQEGVYRAELVFQGNEPKVVPLDRVSFSELSSQDFLKDDMVPVEKGKCLRFDRWLELQKPKPATSPDTSRPPS